MEASVVKVPSGGPMIDQPTDSQLGTPASASSPVIHPASATISWPKQYCSHTRLNGNISSQQLAEKATPSQ